MTVDDFIKQLNGFPGRFKKDLDVKITPVLNTIVSQLAARSPFDTGTFKNQWRISKRLNGLRFVITNPTKYGPFLDEGVEAGALPWFWPNENNPGSISKSGKLILKDRVWAGGRSPAGFVTGGIIDPILMNSDIQIAVENQNKLAEAAVSAVVDSI